MAKAKPLKLFKIGDVIEYGGVSRQTIHYYTTLGILPVARRTRSGHRLYPEEVFDLLDRVKELKKEKTLEEIRNLLQQERRRTAPEGGQT